MRQAEKKRKKFYSRIPFVRDPLDPDKKIDKKIATNLKKIKKPLSDIIFSQNRMRQAKKEKKKKFSPEFRLYSTPVRKFRKKLQKNS